MAAYDGASSFAVAAGPLRLLRKWLPTPPRTCRDTVRRPKMLARSSHAAATVVSAGARESANQAHAHGFGVSFSPAGLLTPYHVGVSATLHKHGWIDEHVPVAGASGGALMAIAIALGHHHTNTLETCLRVNAACVRDGTRFNLHGILRKELEASIVPDAATILSRRKAPVTIALTRLIHWSRLLPHGLFVQEFASREQIISALLASCAIPFYFSRWPAVAYEGWPALDGYFAVPRSKFGTPTIAERTLRVCPFAAELVGLNARHVIAPLRSNNAEQRDAPPQTITERLSLALGRPPPTDSQVEDLFNEGARDADAWVRANSKLLLRSDRSTPAPDASHGRY